MTPEPFDVEWNGTLHFSGEATEPIKVQRSDDGAWHVFTGCCQCRLIHHLVATLDGDTMTFDFKIPDPQEVARIDGARVRAEQDEIGRLQQRIIELEAAR